jgi:putative membrane protein
MKEDSALVRLANSRSILANERTFLAYIRTSIMFAVSAVTLIKFLGNEMHFLIVGILLLPVAVACAAFGFVRHRIMSKHIAQITNPEPSASTDADEPRR